MKSDELDTQFQLAVNKINEHTESFPADVLLKLYAYYKKATNDYNRPGSRRPIINAFKTNALFQIKNLSQEQAKKEYVKLVKSYFLYGK